MAELDVLISLSVASSILNGFFFFFFSIFLTLIIFRVKPKIINYESFGSSSPLPVFKAKNLRHPYFINSGSGFLSSSISSASSSSSFIPNDVFLGGLSPQMLILTGF
jgi:hypothetical protein